MSGDVDVDRSLDRRAYGFAEYHHRDPEMNADLDAIVADEILARHAAAAATHVITFPVARKVQFATELIRNEIDPPSRFLGT